jgi:antitoxin MazE
MGLPDCSPVYALRGYVHFVATTRCVVTLNGCTLRGASLYLHCRHRIGFAVLWRQCVGREGVMRAIVKKWGNSAAVRIPRGIMQAAHLTLDDVVDVREQDGQIVIEPIRLGKVELAQLVAGITPENLHGGVDFGDPVGMESL